MSDPAVEAAQRAYLACTAAQGFFHWPDEHLEVAAREALAPIRKDHYPVAYINRQRCCVRCFDENGKPQVWPCNPAIHAYSSEEL